MRLTSLGLAAIAAFAIPAALVPATATAQTLAGAGFTAGSAFTSGGFSGVTVHHGGSGQSDGGGFNHHQRGGGENFGGVYLAPRDGYDLNHGWASDSYNDWWHDRPDRAFPRWMSSNQDCQRQWWSGGGWRC